MALTKGDLKNIEGVVETVVAKQLEKQLPLYQGAVVEAIGFKFGNFERRMDEFDRKLDRIATVLGNFVKMMTDYKEEFILLKADVDKIKAILREKLGVEISIQG